MQQVAIETTEGLGRRLSLTIAASDIAHARDAELLKTAKNVRMDGFRPGKVPLNIVKQRYATHILQEALGRLMQEHLIKVVVDNKINMASAPTYKPEQYVEGGDFKYIVDFDVYPEITLQGFDKITIEKPVVEIKESDIDAMIDTLRKQQATWGESTSAVATENRVTMDFTGFIDGKEFDGGKASDFVFVTGQNSMLPGFEDAILGHVANDEFEFPATFPENYHVEDLKGKQAMFKATIKKVESLVLPEVDVAFIKRLGIKNGTAEILRDEVKKNMERELKAKLSADVKQQLITGLLAENTPELPRALVEEENARLAEKAQQQFGQKSNTFPPLELFEAEAKRRVTITLLFSKIVEENNLKLDETRVDELIAQIASAYENPEEVVRYYKNDKQMLTQMRNVAMEDMVVDSLLSKVKVSEKSVAFSEFMTANQA